MKKEDLKKGQEVFLLVVEGSNLHRFIRSDSNLARIRKCSVLSVGSKYITVGVDTYKAKFSIEDGFLQVVDAGSIDYKLFLTYDAVIDYLEYQNLKRSIRDFFSNHEDELTLEDLRRISKILKTGKDKDDNYE